MTEIAVPDRVSGRFQWMNHENAATVKDGDKWNQPFLEIVNIDEVMSLGALELV